MWCFIYRSNKKPNSYLYIAHENDFSAVPETLMSIFGKPIFVMKLWLSGQRKMMAATAEQISEKIEAEGYFLQMLNEHDFRVK
ncbi:YcgL domain-containing protein [Utexia brackfieldae]|uniref:YcgL domain-containing protein n=1 Tax=Utexia brackfieldae TaxID=3074108 RepID=UPI00370D5AA2